MRAFRTVLTPTLPSLADSFLPFDHEAAFVSAIVLTTAPACTSLLDDTTPWLRKSYKILDEMISHGNQIAGFRKGEIEQLHGILSILCTNSSSPPLGTSSLGHPEAAFHLPSPVALLNVNDARVSETSVLSPWVTTAEMMALADSIDPGDVDWIAQAVTENQI